MSLFAKGTWRRYVTDPDALQAAAEQLGSNKKTLFANSALAARAILYRGGEKIDSTVGINPPNHPRMDSDQFLDQSDVDKYVLPHFVSNLMDEECEEPWLLPEGAEAPDGCDDVCYSGWADNLKAFNLYRASDKIIGFWLVVWSRQDLEDKPSLREELAASHAGMPFKLVSNDMKKTLVDGLTLPNQMSRKQVPVFIDLNTGDVWLGSGSNKFHKALTAMMGRLFNILLTPAVLSMGGSTLWVTLALNVLRERDLQRLEREEAVEFLMNDSEQDAEEEGSDAEKERDNKRRDALAALRDLAEWTPDNGAETIVLHADANVTLKREAKSSVGTSSGEDALALFSKYQNAELVSCAGSIKLNPPSIDDKGELVRIDLDFSNELATCVYKNLEFGTVRTMWTTILEEPFLEGTGSESLVDSNMNESYYGPTYNRYWLRYYLQLRAFEHALIHSFATVLDLDPELIAPAAVDLFAAAKETVAKSTPNSSGGATVETEITLSSDGLDDVPDAE